MLFHVAFRVSISECFAGGAAVGDAALCGGASETGWRMDRVSHTTETEQWSDGARYEPFPAAQCTARRNNLQPGKSK